MRRDSSRASRVLVGAAAASLLLVLAASIPSAVASAVSAPTITSVTPNSLPQGASGSAVVVKGTNFVSGAKVTSHSGITAVTTFVSATQLDLSVKVAAAEAPGAYNVIVTNPDGGKFKCTGCLTVTGATTPGANWPAYLLSGAHDSYNAGATAITPSNASQLAAAWKWLPPASPNSATTNLVASPTVVNGVVYQGVKDGYVFAVNESNQSVIWSRFLAINTPLPANNPSCGVGDYQGIISTPTVTADPSTGKLTMYVYAPDGFLYALDAATGTIVWKGQVYTPSTTVNDYYSWGSPLVANGKVYIGVSSDCDNPLIPGGLQSFDQSTGAPVARWTSVPAGQVGGSVWSSPALANNGSILVTTGNASASSGQPLYNESIVRLDPSTLGVLDHWQVPTAQQTGDGDFGASPTTFTATLNGVSTPMVGACNKNGVYYAFNQNALSAGPIWQTRISIPYPGGAEECDSAAAWDGTNLIETGGAPTTINGSNYVGSIQSLNPATGAIIWQTGLNGTIVGSPSEDGGGVVAAPTYQTCPIGTTPCESNGGPSSQLGIYLVSVANGSIVGFIPTPKSPLFGQAIFTGNQLLVGAGPSLGLTAYQVSVTGPPITGVSPSTLVPGSATNVTLTGSGFSGTPIATISGDGVTAGKVTVVSSTKVQAKFTVLSTASLGPRNISVSIPGSTPTVDSCSGCLTIATGTGGPTITSVNPNSLAPGASKQPVTVMGTNFLSGAKVTSHSGITIATTFVSATQLDLSVSVATSVAAGKYNLIVTDPGGAQFNCKGCLTVT
jgi:outer membrane protein assembly factor BamB